MEVGFDQMGMKMGQGGLKFEQTGVMGLR
jgi:hypothetical protein